MYRDETSWAGPWDVLRVPCSTSILFFRFFFIPFALSFALQRVDNAGRARRRLTCISKYIQINRNGLGSHAATSEVCVCVYIVIFFFLPFRSIFLILDVLLLTARTDWEQVGVPMFLCLFGNAANSLVASDLYLFLRINFTLVSRNVSVLIFHHQLLTRNGSVALRAGTRQLDRAKAISGIVIYVQSE